MRHFLLTAVLCLTAAVAANAQGRGNNFAPNAGRANTVINNVGNGAFNRLNVAGGNNSLNNVANGLGNRLNVTGNTSLNNVGNGAFNRVTVNNNSNNQTRGGQQQQSGGGLFNNIGNGIGNKTTINIGSNNTTIVQQAAPAPRPVFVLPQISQPIVRPIISQPVISQPTVVVAPAPVETVSSGTVSHIDLPKQSERFLRVRNESGEKLTVFVQIRTDDGQGTKRFFPAAPGGDEAFSFAFEAGQESTLTVGETKLSGDAARIFAVTESGRVIEEFKTKDLTLTPIPYEAAQKETFLFTFGR